MGGAATPPYRVRGAQGKAGDGDMAGAAVAAIRGKAAKHLDARGAGEGIFDGGHDGGVSAVLAEGRRGGVPGGSDECFSAEFRMQGAE